MFRQIAQNQHRGSIMNSCCLVGALVFLSLGLIYNASYYGQCPHPSFKLKHYCEDCRSENEALEFTLRRNDTFRNSVLAGKNLEFKIINGRCQNVNLSTVYECRVNGPNQGWCSTRQNCKTMHATNTGHMFYRQTICQN